MALRAQVERLTPLIEALTTAPNAGERHRMILEGTRDAQLATGVELWLESNVEGQFQRIASDGSTASLPGADQVAAVANGTLPSHLPPDHLVVHAGRAPTRIALALGQVREPEEWEDLLEAILVLAWQMGSPWEVDEPLDLVDTLLAPFRYELEPVAPIESEDIQSLLALMEEARDGESLAEALGLADDVEASNEDEGQRESTGGGEAA